MSRVCVFIVFLSLQSEKFITAFPGLQTLNLQVAYGEAAMLPCDGSAHLEEGGSVQWETSLGELVASLRNSEKKVAEHFSGRVELPSDEQISAGNWSMIIRNAMLGDSGTYQCIWERERPRVVSTVWLFLKDPPVERSLRTFEGDSVTLKCFLQISSSLRKNLFETRWTRNGSTILSIEDYDYAVISSDAHRFKLLALTVEEFHLEIYPVVMADSGEYRCEYLTRDSQTRWPGFPDRIQLTVEQRSPTVHPVSVTHSWTSTSESPLTATDSPAVTEEATESTTSSAVLLEDPTEPIKVDLMELQPMESSEETLTIFPDQGTSSESLQLEGLPWVRIGLISGVLLLTSVVLCALKSQQKI